MGVTVTNASGAITVNDGTVQQSIDKALVSVNTNGDNVVIRWSPVDSLTYNYANFTGSVAGASAAAVALLIAAYLDTGSGGGSNSVTVAYTVGVAGSGADYEFASAANMTEQSIQVGGSAIVPVNSPVTSIVLKCTQAPNSGTMLMDVGNTSGGDEFNISNVDMSALNAIISVSSQVAASASASSVYLSGMPSVNWNTLTTGIWKIWIQYSDNSNN